MLAQKDVYTITGKAFWARVFGAPAKSSFSNDRYWSIDVTLTPAMVERMNEFGLGAMVKTKGDNRGIFCTFERREFKKKTGAPNNPIKVVDADGAAWAKDVLIGNGSGVDATFKVYRVEAFGKSPAHNKAAILEVKVRTLVPYVKKETPSNLQDAGHSWKGDVV